MRFPDIEKKPGLRYKWVNASNKANFENRKAQGWEVVQDSYGKYQEFCGNVLMCKSEDDVREEEKARRDKSRSMHSSVSAAFKHEAEKEARRLGEKRDLSIGEDEVSR